MTFNKLKQAMVTTPVLGLPNFTRIFVLENDACDSGIGVVLIQNNKPLAYFSKALGTKHQALSTYEKEMLAIVTTVNKWRHYLSYNHFIIKTDHQSLKYFLTQRVTTILQQKWLTKLLGLDYEIQYKKGQENIVVDSLSRLHEDNSQLQVISSYIPTWMAEVQQSLLNDPQLKSTSLKQLVVGGDLKKYICRMKFSCIKEECT